MRHGASLPCVISHPQRPTVEPSNDGAPRSPCGLRSQETELQDTREALHQVARSAERERERFSASQMEARKREMQLRIDAEIAHQQLHLATAVSSICSRHITQPAVSNSDNSSLPMLNSMAFFVLPRSPWCEAYPSLMMSARQGKFDGLEATVFENGKLRQQVGVAFFVPVHLCQGQHQF